MLVHANLLLYAALEDFPQYRAAREWLDLQLNGPRRVGLPWPALLACVRITTKDFAAFVGLSWIDPLA